MENLWILSELFYPEETSTSYLLTKIANKMSEKYKVNVICCDEKYDKEKVGGNKSFKVSSEINIIKVKGPNIDKNNNFLLLFYKALRISIALSYSLFRRAGKSDKVLVVTTPVLLLFFVSFVKSIKKIHLNVLVYDVFPENVIATGVIGSKSNVIYKLTKLLFDRIYSRTDQLIVIGHDMKEIVLNKINRFHAKAKVIVIENWAEISSICQVVPDNKGKIVLLYAGNMGRVQGLLELVNIIGCLKNDRLFFSFRGTGALKREMMDVVRTKKIENVLFGASYGRNEQKDILGSCDMALITLAEDMYGLAVPSKSYNIMAAGKPILYIGSLNSEIWRIVTEHKIGFCFQWTEKERLIDFFNNLSEMQLDSLREMGNRVRKLAEQKYSEDYILGKYIDNI